MRKWKSFKEVAVIAQEEIDFKLVLGNIGTGIG